MWRLEDKVEGSERYTASRVSERVTESSVVAGESLGREADQGKTGWTCTKDDSDGGELLTTDVRGLGIGPGVSC